MQTAEYNAKNNNKQKICVFGSGVLGKQIKRYLIEKNFNVITLGSDPSNDFIIDYEKSIKDQLGDYNLDNIKGLVYSQGLNIKDNINNFNSDEFDNLVRANITYILDSLNFMISNKMLLNNSKICILGSIWGLASKENKLSYSITKSAISGLVKSLSIDLGNKNILVNAILPGVVESDMSQRMLSEDQLNSIKYMTPLNRLASPEDIASSVYWLISNMNTFITGQSITVDGGFLVSKYFK